MTSTFRQTTVTAVFIALLLRHTACAQTDWTLESPDGKVAIRVTLAEKAHLQYDVACDGQTVVSSSPLGISRKDQSFVDGLKFVEAGAVKTIDETYTMTSGKRKICRNFANEQTLVFQNADGAKVELTLRAYNDGVAFRYRFPQESQDRYTVTGESTGFRLPVGGKVWAHPYDNPTKYTPAYETYYVNGVPVGTASTIQAGWAFPLLACTSDRSRWLLVTEAGVEPSTCGMRLARTAPDGLYTIRLPDEGEGNHTGVVEPSWTLPWTSSWRVIIVGDSLGDIVESTLVTDLCPPSTVKDTSWIKPGRASWSWLFDHDSPQDCTKLKAWVDLAAEMGWEYSLVDANWDRMKNGTIHDLIAYAKDKGVGLLMWYNSGGPHNYVSEKPRGMMDHPEIRREELQTLRKWGIKGVKVDFFQSDKQNIIQLYHDILKDASEAQIMVNFHGCTLPRGWSRTYPHLMTMEAVRGEECYSFDRRFTTEAPVHNVILPFTRNVVGPMDYTPVMFQDNVYRHLTTYSHELALSVVFESGWLHFAGGPKEYLELPEAPKNFLKKVPTAWDDTKFLAGEPGRFIVLARKSGDSWYVAGINGENAIRNVDVAFSFLGEARCDMTLITDGQAPRIFESKTRTLTAQDTIGLALKPYGGFAAVLTLE